MSPVLRTHRSVESRHLDAMLSAYADRSLPAARLLACDQHVAICPRCMAAVDGERRLLSSLRTAVTPGLSSRFEAALLDLAAYPGATGGPSQLRVAPTPLPVVRRSAPAMHHSPVRAVMLAGLAGASAAAAFSLGVSGVGYTGVPLPVGRLPGPAATATLRTSVRTASFQTVPVAGTQPSVPDIRRGWAQSTKLGTIEP